MDVTAASAPAAPGHQRQDRHGARPAGSLGSEIRQSALLLSLTAAVTAGFAALCQALTRLAS